MSTFSIKVKANNVPNTIETLNQAIVCIENLYGEEVGDNILSALQVHSNGLAEKRNTASIVAGNSKDFTLNLEQQSEAQLKQMLIEIFDCIENICGIATIEVVIQELWFLWGKRLDRGSEAGEYEEDDYEDDDLIDMDESEVPAHLKHYFENLVARNRETEQNIEVNNDNEVEADMNRENEERELLRNG